ncbi:MAG: DedA family protein [Jiangellaceae bacterium]
MGDAIIELLTEAMSSPWIYLGIYVIAALDGFFPVVPAETAVITAGVFAASTGEPSLVATIAVAAAGAFTGDHISYFIGRKVGSRLRDRARPGSRTARAFDWAETTLNVRGGLILVVARYIPAGRTAATLTSGTVGYPLRKFSFFDAIASVSWAIYSAFIGYFGGLAFDQDPIKGLLLGLGIAFTITIVVEVVRALIHRRRRARSVAPTSKELV